MWPMLRRGIHCEVGWVEARSAEAQRSSPGHPRWVAPSDVFAQVLQALALLALGIEVIRRQPALEGGATGRPPANR